MFTVNKIRSIDPHDSCAYNPASGISPSRLWDALSPQLSVTGVSLADRQPQQCLTTARTLPVRQ